MVLLPQRFKSGRGPRDCVRNTSPTFSALETGLPAGNCFPRSVAAQETRVLGRPPYRSPLKIPINVYLAPDTTLLPTGFRLKHSACAAQEKLGTCAGSPQHVLWLFSFLLLLPFSLLFLAWLCTSPQTAAKDMAMAPFSSPYQDLRVDCFQEKEVLCKVRTFQSGSKPAGVPHRPPPRLKLGLPGQTGLSSCRPPGSALRRHRPTPQDGPAYSPSCSCQDLDGALLPRKTSSSLSQSHLPILQPNLNVTFFGKFSLTAPKGRLLPFLLVFMTCGSWRRTPSRSPPIATHTEHSAGHTVGVRPRLMKEDRRVE